MRSSTPLRAIVLWSSSAWLACTSLACGGATPPPQPPEPTAPAPQEEPRSSFQVKGELGSIDPSAVKQVFSSLSGEFERCQQEGLRRIELLSGDAKFFVRVGEDGATKWSYLKESDLGDRETESCLLEAVRRARWPKPEGGDAEVQYEMGFPLHASRPPNEWSPDRLADALAKANGDIAQCKAGVSGPFHATLYIGEGSGKAGKVLAVGVAPPDRDGEDKADCLAKVLKGLKVPTPGTWPAKVGITL